MEKYISLPIFENDIRDLNVGDIVYLSGDLLQILAPAHKRALEFKKEGKPLPFDLENMGIYHCYTCLAENDGGVLHCNFLGASTSAGVNPYEPEFIRQFKIRVIVGKGGMDQATLDAMQEVGCVYLAQIGGCCQLSTQAVVKTKEKIWEDMAANIVIKHEFKDLGPLICCMDSKGNSLFADVNKQVIKNKEEIFSDLK